MVFLKVDISDNDDNGKVLLMIPYTLGSSCYHLSGILDTRDSNVQNLVSQPTFIVQFFLQNLLNNTSQNPLTHVRQGCHRSLIATATHHPSRCSPAGLNGSGYGTLIDDCSRISS